MRKHLLLILLLSAFTFFVSKNVHAQGVTTASVNGIVTDAKGAIPGATVTITHLPTGTVYATVTRIDGRFNLPNLRVGGPYAFKISFIGYKDFVQDNITLSIGQDQKIDAQLFDNTTALKEVTIKGAKQGSVINPNRTGASETINRAEIDALPTLNRSLNDFTRLTPSASSNLSFGGRSGAFNNVTVDGALFNNSFGLATTLGGQTHSQPISLDAIDQIQVDIAPFDVRQGNFSGAGVNTVIKSGTNEVKGTVYDFVRGVDLTGYNVGPTSVTITPFTYRQTGASIGAPIIKNKLFIFVSAEQERISQPATSEVANNGSNSGATVSNVTTTQLNQLESYLETTDHYNPGEYQGYNYATSSDKITVKLDWNLNKNNVLSAKYFYLKSFQDQPASNSSTALGGSRAPGPSTLPFSGSGYRINNNFNIGILELDTRVSSSMSNKLTVGYSALRDFRSFSSSSDLPMVDIDNGTTTATGVVTKTPTAVLTSIGDELFTAGNLLSTNITQFSDDFSIYAGKHEFTFGTNDQIQSYINGFAPEYNGLYTFNSLSDFENNLPASSYTYRNSAVGSTLPYAKIKAGIYSLYAQDKFHVSDSFTLTYGIRADYDDYPTTLAPNPNVTGLVFQQGIQVDPSKLPSNKVQVSPRLGFNWDVFDDAKTQVRGGTGLFAGPPPFVWISNQASNNGLLFGSGTWTPTSPGVTTAGQNGSNILTFNPNINGNRPAAAAANTSYELDIADPKLKNPKIWRTDLAIDQRLENGYILTLEGVFSKDIDAIYHQNLVLSDATTQYAGPEGLYRFNSTNITPENGSTVSLSNPKITSLYYMTNTDKGYSAFATIQLKKSFTNGLYANIAYTASVSKDVNDGGSTASTIWSTRYVPINQSPNSQYESNSSYVEPNRIIASLAYKKAFFANGLTSIGLIYEIANNGAYSYLVSGDPNNSTAGAALMYIPRTQSDIELVPNGATDTRTPAQLWNQLNNLISSDPYLNSHRGQYASRNGAIAPYFNRADLNLTQDFFIMAGKVKHTLEFTFNVINLGNLLDKNWGTYQVSAISGNTGGGVNLLVYKGIDNGTNRPTYAFPYLDATNQIPVTSLYKSDASLNSRWQAQFGVRYNFN
jgi:Carboxypeptidase regulatory-like domain